MISKELLSEVLEIDINNIEGTELKESVFVIWMGKQNTFPYKLHSGQELNIYELAHKCKEWAFNLHNEYELKSSILADCDIISCGGDTIKTFHGISEPEAIFKACEWIKEQHDN